MPNGLDEAQKLFGIGHIGEALPAVVDGHSQGVTVRHGLIALLFHALFELPPNRPRDPRFQSARR
jgi:hypothetical protein